MFYYGMMNALYGMNLSLLSQWCHTFNNTFTPTDEGIFNVCYLVGGVLASYIVGPILGKTKAYKLFTIIVPLGTIVATVVVYFFIKNGDFTTNIFIVGLLGGSVLPAIPVTLEFGAELTFPVNAANSSGALYVAG